MITRQELMNTPNPFDRNTLEGRKYEYDKHCAYYRQFSYKVAKSVLGHLTEKAMSLGKTGSHLNDVPLPLWDAMQPYSLNIFDARALTDCTYPNKFPKGQVAFSLSDVVSISKLIVRDFMLENGYVEIWEIGKYSYEPFLVKVAQCSN